jgi:Tfp pilus assembly protein PilN
MRENIPSLSLMPVTRRFRKIPVRSNTIQVLTTCLILLIASVGAYGYASKQKAQSAVTLENARAKDQQLQLVTARIKKELEALEGIGGTNRLEVIDKILESRVNWKELIVDIANSAPKTLVLNNFNATSPDASTDSTGEDLTQAKVDITLNGQAESKRDIQQFISNIRKSKLIEQTDLQSASKRKGSKQTTFAVTIDLVDLEPLPGATGE